MLPHPSNETNIERLKSPYLTWTYLQRNVMCTRSATSLSEILFFLSFQIKFITYKCKSRSTHMTNCGSGTVDRIASWQPADGAALCSNQSMAAKDAASALTRWQHFSTWNDVMAASLKVWCLVKKPTPSIDAYLWKNNRDKFHIDLIWNDGALGFF